MTEKNQNPAAGEQKNGPKTEAGSPQGEAPAGSGDISGAGSGDISGDAPAGEDGAPDYRALAAEFNDKLLRAVAELENYRRRAEKERQDTAKFAITGFARDCVTVLDNLHRGLATVTKEDRDGNPALEALATGMELTERELVATLERHGIEKVDPLGVPFDYDRHQAMFEVDDASRPAGTVVEVVQPGYMLNGRLLRPAMVAVAKGGPKSEKVQAPIANQDLAAPATSAAPDAAKPSAAPGIKPAPKDGEAAGNQGGPGDGHVDTKA